MCAEGVPEVDERTRTAIVAEVRRFVERSVRPVATQLEHADEYPAELVEQMKSMGLFAATIDEGYGGLALPVSTYARIVEELSRGWMSLSGIVNSHLMVASLIGRFGSLELQRRLLPEMATGTMRGALALTEPDAGSDLQAIRTRADRRGESYIVNGVKAFVTNAVHAQVIAILVRTNVASVPRSKGMSIIIAEKRHRGLSVGKPYAKLGYKGVETAEVVLQDCHVPVTNLVGTEGEGFSYAMSVLEVGRINVAARAVGVAQAAFDAAMAYAVDRRTFGKAIADHQAIQLMLADMATSIQAARLLTYHAAEAKDRGDRVDLEAGMAKLFASEMCQRVVLDSMRIHGGFGYMKEGVVERYYRDAPLMIIGEGTSEIQKLIIARRLIEQYRAE